LAIAQHTAPIPSIEVSGSGEAFAKPDMAELEAGVVSQAQTAAAALKVNSETVAKLLMELRKLGIPERDIRTQNISLHPQYQFQEKRSPQITGFEVRNQVAVKIRDLSRLGEILSRLVEAGGNILSRVSMGVADPSRLLDEARRAALADAKHKAEVYANAAGTRLGRPLLIRENVAQAPPPVPLLERAAVAHAEVPIMPGETSFQVQVSVTYALE
jgi:uncharacterized protein YggE